MEVAEKSSLRRAGAPVGHHMTSEVMGAPGGKQKQTWSVSRRILAGRHDGLAVGVGRYVKDQAGTAWRRLLQLGREKMGKAQSSGYSKDVQEMSRKIDGVRKTVPHIAHLTHELVHPRTTVPLYLDPRGYRHRRLKVKSRSRRDGCQPHEQCYQERETELEGLGRCIHEVGRECLHGESTTAGRMLMTVGKMYVTRIAGEDRERAKKIMSMVYEPLVNLKTSRDMEQAVQSRDSLALKRLDMDYCREECNRCSTHYAGTVMCKKLEQLQSSFNQTLIITEQLMRKVTGPDHIKGASDQRDNAGDAPSEHGDQSASGILYASCCHLIYLQKLYHQNVLAHLQNIQQFMSDEIGNERLRVQYF